LLLLRSEGLRGADVTEEVLPGERRSTMSRAWRMKKPPSPGTWCAAATAPPVLAADTTVTIDGVILGKPADRAEAVAMLQQLSGRTHQVLTSIAVRYKDFAEQRTQISQVRFGALSRRHRRLLRHGEPYDKAGAYGIQGRPAVHRAHRRQPFRHHGPAPVRNRTVAETSRFAPALIPGMMSFVASIPRHERRHPDQHHAAGDARGPDPAGRRAGTAHRAHAHARPGRQCLSGKVVRVLPGMQSAFIDIGLERAAFLHVADIWEARGHDGQNATPPPSRKCCSTARC
jgi:septum formation protein